MPCYHPVAAWQLESGDIVFSERGRIRRPLFLPCGQCIGCKLQRSCDWATRCMNESQLHDLSVFVTLTYDDDHLPTDGGLHYKDFQKFMKRLRKRKGKIRFYMCGEYGDEFKRPHFHAILFGCFFQDRKVFSTSNGNTLYTSEVLDELWPYGFASIGDVTFESAAYVARYCTKKITGPAAKDHYSRVDFATGEIVEVEPEFARMSLKPGIGAAWFEKYRSDVFPDDRIIVNGRPCKVPKFYDKLLKAAQDFESDFVEYARYRKSLAMREHTTPDRLAVREVVARAALSLKKRSL